MSTTRLILLLAAIRGACFPAMRVAVPLAGTALLTGFNPRILRLRREVAHG